MRARPRGMLRGAGGAIGGGGGLFGRPNDHFRTRAPNTSRPPSMHVDDFVKFEQSASSGGGDKVPVIGSAPLPVINSMSSDLMRRLDKDMPMLRGRGRGFDRMRGRARFQTAPANFKPGFPRGFRGGRGGRMNFIPNQRPPMTVPLGGGGPPRIGNMGGGNNIPIGGTGSLLKPYFASPRFNRGGGTPGPFNKNDRRSFSPPQQKTNRNDRRGDMRDRFSKPRGRGGHYMPGPFRDRDAMLMPPPVRSRDRMDKMDGRGPDRNKHHRSYTK